jgi:hypothetical protein
MIATMTGLTRAEFLRRASLAGVTLSAPIVLAACNSRDEPRGQWFRASKPGEVPTSRRPRIESVELPPGRGWVPEETYGPRLRHPVAWVTDEGTDDAFALARKLARVFPVTGLWPCLWLYPESPAAYSASDVRLAPIEESRTEAILKKEWERDPPQLAWVAPLGTDWPGLADPTTAQPEVFDAFRHLERWERASDAISPDPLRPRLMLVPCTRPADAVAATYQICGSAYAGVENPGDVSSVLRSWERRFAAVFVAAEPGVITLAVGAPPESPAAALRIAAEQFALAPREDAGAPEALIGVARELLAGNPPYTLSGRHIWALGWDD